MAMLNIIQPRVNLQNVLSLDKECGQVAKSKTTRATRPLYAHLKCFFCFHPHKHHYMVYCYDPVLQLWILFDDSKVQPVGRRYHDAAMACSTEGFMPHVFFYEL